MGLLRRPTLCTCFGTCIIRFVYSYGVAIKFFFRRGRGTFFLQVIDDPLYLKKSSPLDSLTILNSRSVEGEGLTLRNSLLLSGFSVFSGYEMLWEVKFHLQIIFGGDCPPHYPAHTDKALQPQWVWFKAHLVLQAFPCKLMGEMGRELIPILKRYDSPKEKGTILQMKKKEKKKEKNRSFPSPPKKDGKYLPQQELIF